MAITEFSSGRAGRRRVAYFGEAPSDGDAKAFTDRGYQLSPYTEEDLDDSTHLSVTDSVIFSQNADKPTRILDDLTKYGGNLLDHDCRIYVRLVHRRGEGSARAFVINAIDTLELPPAGLPAEEIKKLGSWFAEREGIPQAPYLYVCDVSLGWSDIAKLIAENPAGKSPNLNLRVHATNKDGANFALSKEEALLVQRAFWDCSVVHLIQMDDGLSGVPAYRVYGQLATGLLGPWPFLYFLKIGRRDKITREYRNYQGNALSYVPFHLGPRLNPERCGLGARHGVLVGDFVEEAESLRDCASGGRAVPAIANLFNRTLRAWHDVSQREDSSVPDCLLDLFPTEDIPKHREPLIRALGATLSIAELRRLFRRCDSKPVLIGPIHGDLHATNVLVRSTDAIVIDFEKLLLRKPLVYDAASLEGGLLVEGFVRDSRNAQDCLSSVESLYENVGSLEWGAPCHPKDPSAWYYTCVRQIRIHAIQLQCKPGQYAAALALALVKKACNPEKFDNKREGLRAAAFFLAEKLLKATSDASEK